MRVAQLTDRQKWWVGTDIEGATVFAPADFFSRDTFRQSVLGWGRESGNAKIEEDVQLIEGWGVRLSSPGYLDCTAWEVFQDEEEAIRRFNELRLEESHEPA